MRVLVIGAGIIGAHVAYRLSQMRHQVDVIDASTPGKGVSRSSFAWINANDRATYEYHLLCAGGMAGYEWLGLDPALAPWIHRCGSLEVAVDEAGATDLLAKVHRLQRWSYPIRLVSDLAELRDTGIHTQGEILVAAHCVAEGYVDVQPLIGALLRRVVENGGRVHWDKRVKGLDRKGKRIFGVVMEDGAILRGDVTILCAGTGTVEIMAEVGFPLPLSGKKGAVAVITTGSGSISQVVHVPNLSLRPDGGGRVMLHAHDLDQRVDEVNRCLPGEALDELIRRAEDVISSPSERGEVLGVEVGIRPQPADGLPAVGHVPTVSGLYMVTTHSGVTLAPILSTYVAVEVVEQRSIDALALFRPERFTT